MEARLLRNMEDYPPLNTEACRLHSTAAYQRPSMAVFRRPNMVGCRRLSMVGSLLHNTVAYRRLREAECRRQRRKFIKVTSRLGRTF